ncbi:unnamed protein product [Didymodactylos carnosus]|uniref:Uncharacterized protein n=1 Tax=Didymodactylos carnosus TaxID=1234261 RepID=A0A815VDE5_9BILA|nr:unnamed protein product [Didymodactylos carnosus]CAF4390816.1 unnamed protein product [Didymodactylos carnosus]
MDEREDKKDICRFFNVNQFTKTEEKESNAETIQELTSNHTTKTAVDESSVIRNTVQRVYSIINSGKHLLLSLIIIRDCYFKPVLEDETQVMIGIVQQIVEEVGIEIARKVLEKTYIKWNHILPSKKSMIGAGWFYSGKKDLVICIYCGMTHSNWKPENNPLKIHQSLSPNCLYITFKSKEFGTQSNIQILNSNAASSASKAHRNVSRMYCCSEYAEVLKRQKSFQKWPNEPISDVEQVAKAGFYFTGTDKTIQCFCCGGFLLDFESTDNPIARHIENFPYCEYMKHLTKKEKCAFDNDDCFRPRQVTELKSKGYSLDGGA